MFGVFSIVGQIRVIFKRNRANDDTSIKFGTIVLNRILIKYARLANWKSKMAAIFQDGRQNGHLKLMFPLKMLLVVQFAWSKCGFLMFSNMLMNSILLITWLKHSDTYFSWWPPVNFQSYAVRAAGPPSATVHMCSCRVACRGALPESTCIFLCNPSYRNTLSILEALELF